MNPDEHVWTYLKGLFRSDPIAEHEDLSDAVRWNMGQISADPSLVRRFFDHPDVQYVRQALHW